MDMATWAVVIAAGALLMNFTDKVFGGGSRLSGRLAKIETNILGIQEDIKTLVEAMRQMADMRGDIRVLDTRLLAAEKDIRELRHGEGFVRNQSPSAPGINREYP